MVAAARIAAPPDPGLSSAVTPSESAMTRRATTSINTIIDGPISAQPVADREVQALSSSECDTYYRQHGDQPDQSQNGSERHDQDLRVALDSDKWVVV